MLATGRPNERPPSVAQLFNVSDAAFFHIAQIREANWLASAPSGLREFAKTRTKEARNLRETRPARCVQ